MNPSKEFVDGWTIAQTLGEGAYGEVKLLINSHSGDAVAMKMVDLKKHPDAINSVKKEVAIQRNLQHVNILKFFGKRSQGDTEFIFLEYASGGELFDRIEPDVGMNPADAQRYFRQLLSGVEYLHEKGIAHRDLKPENLLLDEHDNIKISDFGMATMFRMKGRERLLTTKCGTLPYVAPEVLSKPYAAVPADIWSCGIILVTLLSGELPWDQPTTNCIEYLAWESNNYQSRSPWTKLNTLAISLLRKILAVEPEQRLTLSNIMQHRWCMQKIKQPDDDLDVTDSGTNEPHRNKRLCSNQNLMGSNTDDSLSRMCLSQPMPSVNYSVSDVSGDCEAPNNASTYGDRISFCFSQPTMMDDMLLCTQMNATQCANPFQRLVKRMTRFCVTTSFDETVQKLTDALEKLGFKYKTHDENLLTIMTTDRRKADLIFKATLLEMDGKIMLDFRLSKGCGLDFKRGFIKIRETLTKEGIVAKIPTAFAFASILEK
ncbi:serine/threonine-protein kinase grp [Culicoides brevitarsis]|uniref:serine/threonine-protein kinase grp n=1 Tax=Culicoides brevitarsis TaxID=469753 RepID=UPI00307BD10D